MAEEPDLTDALNMWLDDIKKYGELSIEELSKLSDAGADAYKKNLEDVTNRKHRSKHDDKVYGHMADNIYKQNKNIDGTKDGTAVVGFDAYHARNANILNSGSKYIQGDNFITNTQENSKDDVLKAEYKEYQKLMKQKGVDNE